MKKFLFINTRDELYRIDISRIAYIESDGNYTGFIMLNGTRITLCMNLAKVQELLSVRLKEAASMFARVGKRHIVNLEHVFEIAVLRQKLILSDGHTFEYQLSISKEALKKLRDIYITSLSHS